MFHVRVVPRDGLARKSFLIAKFYCLLCALAGIVKFSWADPSRPPFAVSQTPEHTARVCTLVCVSVCVCVCVCGHLISLLDFPLSGERSAGPNGVLRRTIGRR